MKNTDSTQTTKCDGRTSKGECSRNATIVQEATAFTSELHFCKTHDKINTREWLATMNAYTR